MKYLYYPVILLLLILAIISFFPLLMSAGTNWMIYQWMLYGMLIYFVLRRFSFFAKNEMWLQTVSHEVNHAIVGMMFFHKIHSLQASEESGVVYHSGRKFGDIFISLAPYCLPVLTYILLFVRLMIAHASLYIFDMFVGFTLAFYIVSFWRQTRPYQTDIQNQGYVRSYLFIITAWFFNASIILLTIANGVLRAFETLFRMYWDFIVSWFRTIF